MYLLGFVIISLIIVNVTYPLILVVRSFSKAPVPMRGGRSGLREAAT
jgi:hypothetical protein